MQRLLTPPCESKTDKSPLPCGGDLGVGKIAQDKTKAVLDSLDMTHPLAPSAREGGQKANPTAMEGGQERCDSAREGGQKASPSPCGRDLGWGSAAREGESLDCHESATFDKNADFRNGESLRFGGFSDKWQEFRLGDIFEVTRGYVLPTKEIKKIQDKEYCYPVYSSQTANGGLLGYYKEFLFENCITWTTDGANAGEVNFRAGKFYCTNVCGVLINKNGYANKCVAEIINAISKKYVSYVGNAKLMNNVMSGIKIKLPTLAEQKKIAQVLSVCDKEIAILDSKLQCLKTQKRGLMQQLLSGNVRVKC
ncbi:restriction endonuclease subunit S [Helicobacter sp. T3_23-1056]